jgi:transcriptional regulator with XRE-family HTH domain
MVTFVYNGEYNSKLITWRFIVGVREIFGQRIKELREENGLGVRELATILGISHSAISLYESCRRTPDIDVCKLFADYFKVSGDYLIGISDERR